MEIQIQEIISLAAQLPTGLVDPKALDKLYKERSELEEAIQQEDRLGTIMEAGDCTYYLIKSEVNGLISIDRRDNDIAAVAAKVSLSVEALLECVIAKMALRAQPDNPKNDIAERAAVAAVLVKILLSNIV